MGNTGFSLVLMMALLLLHFVVSFSTKTTTNISTDQSALLALKAHIVSHPQKTLKTNWSTTTSICNWVGVTCGSRHQRVIALNLSSMLLTGYNGFTGEIPKDMFDHLSRLQVLTRKGTNPGKIP
ncbi:LRR receptor-like serine/threonine-protein kinase EFR [Gossypium hirsutum]|uniref:LRR receptor-like serine/threonine-protein kinase EFR n=1 Tax=Gossypium hirsutum TaxID=3635 RepID=A0A1U8KHZ5_GOSHI|nr:LRR receptor-like serine/threonine-protein kinase EFR [Gossypium hirsutum]